ncbi:GlxA family transcriptional regulator [Teredinibacter haidensis]|uniref:GlxA family transcriptional regulator n=1 Tax=Teredinibacter haidensis TaxID=2731755 RepID=UPI0009491BC1|nr:helix-turn-helix domain-containing protein [Teredinibacter haidensis]
MLKVTFLLCDNMLATSATLPLEQLRAASIFARTGTDATLKKKHLKVTLASTSGAPIKTHTGFTLTPDCSIEASPLADIVYLPALWRNPEPTLKTNRTVIPWLQQHFQHGSILAGVGTGCWFLAEAGLLEGKPATTHWYYFDRFAQQFPNIQLKRNHFITQAGNIYCTGSINALADLNIYFIQQHFNDHIASNVERHFFHEIRSAYTTSAFQETHTLHPDESIVQAQEWLQHHYNGDIKLSGLAEQFGMSVRTFNRRFKAATHTTPLNYLKNIRLDSAKDLLQNTNLSISEIVFRSGYQDSNHFTKLFKLKHGTTPSQYRTTVRAKLFSP